jgi:hypothetical protein
MLDFIFQKLESIATCQNFAILLVAFVICGFFFTWRQNAIGKDIKTFDARWWGYTPGDARQLLTDLGKEGRQIYILTELTLDVVFPFVYGGMVAILLCALYKSARYLLLVPLIMIAADLLENMTASYLAWSFKENASPLAWVAASFTLTKWAGVVVSALLLLFGMVIFICRKLK